MSLSSSSLLMLLLLSQVLFDFLGKGQVYMQHQPSMSKYGWEKRTDEDLRKVLVHFNDIEMYICTHTKNGSSHHGSNRATYQSFTRNASTGGNRNIDRVIDFDNKDGIIDKNSNTDNTKKNIADNINIITSTTAKDINDIRISTVPYLVDTDPLEPVGADNCDCWMSQLLSIRPALVSHCKENLHHGYLSLT